MQNHVEVWLWFVRDVTTGKLRVTRHRLCADDAESIHPGARRVPGTMLLHAVKPSIGAELGVSINAWVRGVEPPQGSPPGLTHLFREA